MAIIEATQLTPAETRLTQNATYEQVYGREDEGEGGCHDEQVDSMADEHECEQVSCTSAYRRKWSP